METRITIPKHVLSKERVSNIPIQRLGNKSFSVNVNVEQSDLSGLLQIETGLPEPLNIIFLMTQSGSENDLEGQYCLKIKDGTPLDELNEETKLTWVNYPTGESLENSNDIVNSWFGKFNFKEDLPDLGQKGLRKPQLGALHAISGYFATDKKKDPATVVLPTGTGKTETMLATTIYQQCHKVLVVVPSNALRDQISLKFLTLGYLKELGVVNFDCNLPFVAKLNKGLHTEDTVMAVIEKSNVIVATASILNSSSKNMVELLCSHCSHLFVDEAHHISANSWSSIREYFEDKSVIQFTATPFRNDGKSLGGKIIYNYTMGEAQRAGFFMPVNMEPIEEYLDDNIDESLAQAAIQLLRNDLGRNLDHLLLARVSSKKRAQEVHEIYSRLAPDLSPVLVYSGMAKGTIKESLDKLHTFQSKVIICVDMLGEGYDLPNLKVAAIHDIHKSLAVTLQFIGRFTRVDENQSIGEASVVVNVADPEVEKNLQALYAQGAEWDEVLRRLSEHRIDKEVRLQEVVESLKQEGDLHKVISLWNLKPSLSAMLFKTKCVDWNPGAFSEDLPKYDETWYSISEDEKLLIVMGMNTSPVKFGNYKDLRDLNYKLLIAHWHKEKRALFIFSNDYKGFRTEKLAKNICGEDCEVLSGESIFNVFNNIEYPLVRNLGASQIGAISFTQFFGPNVTEGLSKIEQSELNLNNIATIGYEAGDKVLWGCSEKNGKIWSPQVCESIPDWRDWVHYAWGKIEQGGIDRNNITRDFLKPEKVTQRHESFPVSVQWGEYIQSAYEDKILIKFGGSEVPFYLVNIDIDQPAETGLIRIKIESEQHSSIYELEISNRSPNFEYRLVEGNEVLILRGSRDPVTFSEYMYTDPIYINYIDGAFSYNCFLIQVNEDIGMYPIDDLIGQDWSDIDITSESMGKTNNQNTVQYKTLQIVQDDYDIIVNDDGSGEAADLVCFKIEDEALFVDLIHCKYSSSDNPGSRVADLYEVCGQAQRSIRWKHMGIKQLYKRIKHRDQLWRSEGYSRFLKGDLSDLTKLKNMSRTHPIKLKVTIVQPGMKVGQASDEMRRLLGSTAHYIKKTTEAELVVIGSH